MLGTAWGSQVERGSLVTRDGLCIRVQERSLLGGSEAVRHVGLFDRRVAEEEFVCDCYQRVATVYATTKRVLYFPGKLKLIS